MTDDEIRASYRATCLHDIVLRRFTGKGETREPVDYPMKGNARLYLSTELLGSIRQGDYKVIVPTENMEAAGMTLPLKSSDVPVIDGQPLGIVAPQERKGETGTVIAYEIHARGG